MHPSNALALFSPWKFLIRPISNTNLAVWSCSLNEKFGRNDLFQLTVKCLFLAHQSQTINTFIWVLDLSSGKQDWSILYHRNKHSKQLRALRELRPLLLQFHYISIFCRDQRWVPASMNIPEWLFVTATCKLYIVNTVSFTDLFAGFTIIISEANSGK